MMFGLVNASLSLPKWQAVKMTFFAPCINGENEAFLLMSPLRNVVPQDVLTAINRPPNFEERGGEMGADCFVIRITAI